MKGFVQSVQSMGAVDGPGLRFVVFMQGCPLRCVYCHNPETWTPGEGQPVAPEELLEQVKRYRPYFGEQGGVTLSGGEPLYQADFAETFFRLLHTHGIHTALDTSGVGKAEVVKRVLAHTDLILCDLKFPTEEGYQKYCGGSLRQTLNFLRITEEQGIPLWIRHVVAPGLTDAPESLRAVRELAESFSNLKKIEWLPFKNICAVKYKKIGLSFPMESRASYSQEMVEALLKAAGI